ncbi:hypothetical protein KI387_004175, partial [Taxus chinensis]
MREVAKIFFSGSCTILSFVIFLNVDFIFIRRLKDRIFFSGIQEPFGYEKPM